MCIRLLWVALWLHYALRQLHSSCLWQVSAVIWLLLSWDSGTYTVLRFTHSVASIPTVSSLYVEDWPQFFRDAGSPFTNLLHITQSVSQFSHSVASDSLQPRGLQHARPPCPSPTHGVYPNSCLSSRWCHTTISSSVVPFPTFNISQHQGLFQWVSSLHQVAKVLEFQLQHQSFQWKFILIFNIRMDWLDLLAAQHLFI